MAGVATLSEVVGQITAEEAATDSEGGTDSSSETERDRFFCAKGSESTLASRLDWFEVVFTIQVAGVP